MIQKNKARRENWSAPCAYCNNTGWVCENHFWREAHTCECGGSGKPCRCNKANPPWDFIPSNTLTRGGEDVK